MKEMLYYKIYGGKQLHFMEIVIETSNGLFADVNGNR